MPHARRLRFEPLEDRRLLSITVNTSIDENDGIGVGGISLREAIQLANDTPGADTIDFAPELDVVNSVFEQLTSALRL